jgi:crotonobetainyl-CoA:carnitine CoA-transferase CaiB-like acyl-CoA transferase
VYRRRPPLLGEHTEELLNEVFGLQADERETLRADGII